MKERKKEEEEKEKIRWTPEAGANCYVKSGVQFVADFLVPTYADNNPVFNLWNQLTLLYCPMTLLYLNTFCIHYYI